MSDTPRTDKEIVGELLVFASFARKLERELAAVTEERDEAREESAKWHQMSIEADTRFVEVMRERDQYKGLLIRLYNDLFVHHKGEAVRDFKELFREENYN
jgi:hypothetical protein